MYWLHPCVNLVFFSVASSCQKWCMLWSSVCHSNGRSTSHCLACMHFVWARERDRERAHRLQGLASGGPRQDLKAVAIRSFFKMKKEEGNEVQARLEEVEEVEEVLPPVADHVGKSEVNWHASQHVWRWAAILWWEIHHSFNLCIGHTP